MSGSPDEIRARLSKIRVRIDRLADDQWTHEVSGDGDSIVARRAVFAGDGKRVGFEAPAVLCGFGPEATVFEKELVRDAVADLCFVLEQLTVAGKMIRDLRSASRAEAAPAGRNAGRPTKDYAAEAAMKCNEASFQTYLRERHATDDDGDLSDSANAAAVLRRALRIGARSELNTDAEAAQRWRDMRADYQSWGQR